MSTSTVKPATAAAVSRALTAAGLPKAQYHASGMVRGWGTWTNGVRATEVVERRSRREPRGRYADGSTRYVRLSDNRKTGVVHVDAVYDERLANSEQRAEQALTAAVAALTARGYAVERCVSTGAARTSYLTVSRRDADGNVVTPA